MRRRLAASHRTAANRRRDKTGTSMKKKLNLFCTLIFVVIACHLLSMSNTFFTGFSAGMKHGMEERSVTETTPSNFSHITLLPAVMDETTAVTVTDKATSRQLTAWPTQLIVPLNESLGPGAAVFRLLYTLLYGAAAVAALVAFILFVRNVNRNAIFTRRNITLLRVVGWCLVATGAIATADGCYDTYLAQRSFSLTGYVVDYGSAAYITSVIFGLFAVVVAEAFAIGLRMKEEQELTI